MRRKKIFCTFLFLGLFYYSRLYGDELEKTNEALWEWGMVLLGIAVPHYIGSDQRHYLLTPLPFFLYRGKFLKLGRNERRGIFYNSKKILIDTSFGGGLPVDSDKNEARRGMPDLLPVFQAGLQWSYRFINTRNQKLLFQIPARKAFSVNVFSREKAKVYEIGNVYELHLDFQKFLDEEQSWRMSLGASLRFADSNFYNFYYKVREEEVLPDRPKWESKSGYGGWDVDIFLNKKIGSTSLNVYYQYFSLLGSVVENSPLVRNKKSWIAGFAIFQTFGTSR